MKTLTAEEGMEGINGDGKNKILPKIKKIYAP